MVKSDQRSSSAFSSTLSRIFPTPQLLDPRAVGVDISDASTKWLTVERDGGHYRVGKYGDEPLSQGIVVEGVIKDVPALVESLKSLKTKWGGYKCAHAALPEEAAYVFNMNVPRGTSREQTLRMIEFDLEARVPIPPSQAVYDFDVIGQGESDTEIGVFVFPIELAQSYVEAFNSAGITLLSLEIEARSISRAITCAKNDPITMIVDFGRARTGITVVKKGIPIFTTTVMVGGDMITHAVEQHFGSPEAAQIFKNERGLFAESEMKKESADLMVKSANALADEVARHFRYWDTRRNEQEERMTPVERVLLIGGSSNLMGLDDLIASKVQAETTRGNIWRHIATFDDYIPPIDKRTSMQYATAVGLALRSIVI